MQAVLGVYVCWSLWLRVDLPVTNGEPKQIECLGSILALCICLEKNSGATEEGPYSLLSAHGPQRDVMLIKGLQYQVYHWEEYTVRSASER